MKKIYILLATFIIGCNITFANAILPAGVNVPFVFTHKVSSENLQVMQRIKITVAEDVKNQDQIFFKKGTEGYIIVNKVIPARRLNKQGEIYFKPERYNSNNVNVYGVANAEWGGQSYANVFIEDVNNNVQSLVFRCKYEGARCLGFKIFTFAMI